MTPDVISVHLREQLQRFMEDNDGGHPQLKQQVSEQNRQH